MELDLAFKTNLAFSGPIKFKSIHRILFLRATIVKCYLSCYTMSWLTALQGAGNRQIAGEQYRKLFTQECDGIPFSILMQNQACNLEQ